MNQKENTHGGEKTVAKQILAFLAGSLIFVGIPLLGWGITRLPEYFGSTARTAYVIVAFLLQLFAIYYNPQVGRSQVKRKKETPERKIDLYLIQLFSLSIVFFAPFSDHHSIAVMSYNDLIRASGLLLLIPGFLLMQAAEKYLGRQFSVEVTLQEDHKLIQRGPYKHIRHPRYLGILLFFLGISIMFRSLLSICLVAGLSVILIWRIFAEESLLQQEFGKEWDEYRTKSWRLIPFIF